MFIITAKCSKRRVVKILLIFALLLSLFLALRACRHSSPPPVIAAGTNEERIAYLASLGWEVNDQPIETLSVTLGETLEEPYLSYNDLQRSQGLDLTRYCGQTRSRYTYVVPNYPDASLPCQADLYVCDGALAAGDIVCTGENGFMAGHFLASVTSPRTWSMCSCVMRMPSRSSSVRFSTASDCVMRRQEMPASMSRCVSL